MLLNGLAHLKSGVGIRHLCADTEVLLSLVFLFIVTAHEELSTAIAFPLAVATGRSWSRSLNQRCASYSQCTILWRRRQNVTTQEHCLCVRTIYKLTILEHTKATLPYIKSAKICIQGHVHIQQAKNTYQKGIMNHWTCLVHVYLFDCFK